MSHSFTPEERETLAALAAGEVTTKQVEAHGVGADPDDFHALEEAYGVTPDQSGKLTVPQCRAFRRAVADGVGAWRLAEVSGRSRSDVHRHAIAKACQHNDAYTVDDRRCLVIREMAHDGLSYPTIAEYLTSVSRQMARYHATGQCAHEVATAPIGARHETWSDEEGVS